MNKPNAYLVEIIGAEYKKSKAGNPMFQVQLGDVNERHKLLCLDWIMFTGNAAKWGEMKLRALGIKGEMNAERVNELLGKRAVVMVKADSYNGRAGWKVDSNAEGFDNGYMPKSAWKDDPREKVAPTDAELLFGSDKVDGYDPADADPTPF